MKSIEPVSIWNAGQLYSASLLSIAITHDNLINTAVFYYRLIVSDENLYTLADGNITMNPEEYELWDNSNDYVYSFVADKLNLTLQNIN